jgi:hypothetical protein
VAGYFMKEVDVSRCGWILREEAGYFFEGLNSAYTSFLLLGGDRYERVSIFLKGSEDIWEGHNINRKTQILMEWLHISLRD